MTRTIGRQAGIAVLAAALAGCGGDDGGSRPVKPQDRITVTLSTPAIAASAVADAAPARTTIDIAVTGAAGQLYVGFDTTLRGIEAAHLSGATLESMQLEIDFKDAGTLPDGPYADTVNVRVCQDLACTQPVGGTPIAVPVRLAVSGSAMASLPRTAAAPTAFLAHDVVDAAYSRPLGAVVMAGALPSPALYVYDPATGQEQAIALSKAPTSLTLSPGGTRAVVGHDAMVSVVDLADPAAGVREQAVATAVWDMVLDAHDQLQVFPAADPGMDVFTLDLDAGTGGATRGGFPAKTRARLHPSGDRFYTLDTTASPETLQRFAIDGSGFARTGQSPYGGDWAMCGNFWFSEAGDRIYTACGNTFTAADDPAQDMRYAGHVTLTANHGTAAPNLVWLDDSAALGQAAMLDAGACGGQGGADCATLLRVTETRHDGLVAAWWLPPVVRDADVHVQHGLFVWHQADGSLLMLGRLAGMADATRAYYVDTVVASNTGSTAVSPHAPRASAR